jgi:benzoyl-CoA reductase/2-hydroxyglutaryl-CoA dehydratase subunit BcrC/BadD/HgdB
LANQVFFYDNPARFTESVNKICDELEKRIEDKKGVFPKNTPRILVSGCPQAVPNWKLPMIVETAGAVIVGEESCVGERGTRNLTDDSGETVDEMLDAIVDRYFQVDCAIFTPNPDRLNHIQEMVTAYKADGVIHYGLQFCQPYLMEAIPVEKALEEKEHPLPAHRNRLQHGGCRPAEDTRRSVCRATQINRGNDDHASIIIRGGACY